MGSSVLVNSRYHTLHFTKGYTPLIYLIEPSKLMGETNREQRDLAWSIRQPALIKAGDVWPSDDWFQSHAIPKVDVIDAPPDRFRLGIHFEKLIQTWLNASTQFDLLESNLQVHAEGRTLGEFDLLVADQAVHEHWELAVKFYINQDTPDDPSHWYGPDPSDSLASKLQRLESHQLTLADQPAAKQLLDSKDIQISARRSIVKGRLYYPWLSFHQQKFSYAACVNPEHEKGWWLSIDDLKALKDKPVVYLEKRYWLSPVIKHDRLEPLDWSALVKLLANTNQIAPQFAVLDEDGDELSRGFVLKHEWFEQVAAQET